MMSGPPPTVHALRARFPACEDAPLALALVRLLARGKPVTNATLAAVAERPIDDVAAQLARWPNTTAGQLDRTRPVVVGTRTLERGLKYGTVVTAKAASTLNAKAPPGRGSRAVGDGAVTVIVGG
jgi:hypothetical protein